MQTIRVAASTSVPHVEYNVNAAAWSGIFVTTLNSVCNRLSFRCQYFIPPYNNLANETLDGVMGALTNFTADVGLAPVGITFSRFQHFHLIDSFLRTTYFIVIHKNQLVSVEPSAFIVQAIKSLFTTGVWYPLFGVLLTFVGLGTCSHWCSKRLTGSAYLVSFKKLFCDWTFRILGSGLGGSAGIDDFEPRQSRRVSSWPLSKLVLLATWLIYTFVIISVMGARLPVLLAFDTLRISPFTNIQELLRSNFTIYGTDTAFEILNMSKTHLHSELAHRMRLFANLPKSVTPEPLYVDLAKSGKNALILKEKTLVKMAAINCDLIVAIDDVGTLAVAALLLPKNSTLQDRFEKGYAEINQQGASHEGGRQFARFIKNATRPKLASSHSCYRQTTLRKPTAKRHIIRLENIAFLFYIFAIALGVSVGVWCCEVVTKRIRIL